MSIEKSNQCLLFQKTWQNLIHFSKLPLYWHLLELESKFLLFLHFIEPCLLFSKHIASTILLRLLSELISLLSEPWIDFMLGAFIIVSHFLFPASNRVDYWAFNNIFGWGEVIIWCSFLTIISFSLPLRFMNFEWIHGLVKEYNKCIRLKFHLISNKFCS